MSPLPSPAPDDPSSDENILNDPLLKEILANKRAAVEKSRALAKERTVGTSPYYNSRYALFIKPTLDEMLIDREPRCFPYMKFPKMKPSTLYSMISQGFRYIIDQLDDEQNTYQIMRGEIEICREHNGIHLYFKTDTVNIITGEPFKADIIGTKAEHVKAAPKWKSRLFDFIEDEKQSRFYEEKLILNEQDIREINEMVAEIPTIMPYVKTNYIRMFRGTEEQVRVMKEAMEMEREQ